jgi:plastocyanin
MKSMLVATAAALWMAAACPPTLAGDANADAIVISNFMFSPMDTTIKAGTRVTWTNQDEEPHTIASSDGLFRSGALDTGESYSFEFDKPGTYHYVCTIHPRMIATITVQ